MDKIYYYTSEEKWISVLESGFLDPSVEDEDIQFTDLPNHLINKIKNKKYLIGIPYLNHTGWIDYGLEELLIQHVLFSKSKEKQKLIIVEVPILNKDGVFVREHKYFSPRQFIEGFGEDLYSKYFQSRFVSFAPENERNAMKEALLLYIKSVIMLVDYKEDFIAPEVWLPQKIPINLLKIVS